jgi:hypothetical protein
MGLGVNELRWMMAHRNGRRVPTRCREPFEHCFLSGSFFIQMERLRIEFGREPLERYAEHISTPDNGLRSIDLPAPRSIRRREEALPSISQRSAGIDGLIMEHEHLAGCTRR